MKHAETRTERFEMRVNEEEMQMLDRLAARMERSRSDAVRLLIRHAHRAWQATEANATTTHEEQIG